MPLDHWLSKEPKRFVYFHRAMGYGMLSLITIVYHYTMADTRISDLRAAAVAHCIIDHTTIFKVVRLSLQ